MRHVIHIIFKNYFDVNLQQNYWLLDTLTGWYVQSVPCNCDHIKILYVPHLSSNNSRFIHQSSLLWLQHTHVVAKRGETG
jgi:hypothetical protein